MSAWSFYESNQESHAFWEGAFSPPECESIIKMGIDKGLKQGGVQSLDDNNAVDTDIRSCSVSWINPIEESDWLYRRCSSITIELNKQFFNFDLFGILEDMQFTRYEASGERYGKHIDVSINGSIRKLSFVLQLSNPKDYEGGELVLHLGEVPTVIPKKQGFVTVFPSYVLHEVTPVTKGTRYSLVSWITGKPFK